MTASLRGDEIEETFLGSLPDLAKTHSKRFTNKYPVNTIYKQIS